MKTTFQFKLMPALLLVAGIGGNTLAANLLPLNPFLAASAAQSSQQLTSAVAPLVAEAPTAGNSLQTGQELGLNQFRTSSNGQYRLYLQGDGNVVLRKLADGQAIWSNNTAGKGGVRLTLQSDSNLVLYTAAGVAVWASGSNGSGATHLIVQSDGNLVLATGSGNVVWATNTGSGAGSGTGSGGSSSTGTRFAAGVNADNIQNTGLTEISGCAASRINSNVFWMHNDSGDSARIYAVGSNGASRGTYTLSGASASDYEDIAVGPGPVSGRSYIYVGDIGDNGATRNTKQVYRMAEPTLGTGSQGGTLATEKFTFLYPDGPRDAETLLVDPLNADVYIVSKRESSNRVYRFKAPLENGKTYTGVEVARINISGLDGGDISADGRRILIRNGSQVYLWLRAAGESVGTALARTPIKVPTASEPQGEAVCWDKNGIDYYTISEGRNQPLYYFRSLDR
jgi:hypothetical protein